jgi:TonB family protein
MHVSRQLRAWLIFDVRQNMKFYIITTLIWTFAAGCTSPGGRVSTALEAPVAQTFVDWGHARLPLYYLQEVHPTHLVRPEYPEIVKQQNVSADATVRVCVAADGSVAGIDVLKSEPNAEAGESARKAVAQWHFPRLLKDGAPIAYCIDVPVVFAPKGTPILSGRKCLTRR